VKIVAKKSVKICVIRGKGLIPTLLQRRRTRFIRNSWKFVAKEFV